MPERGLNPRSPSFQADRIKHCTMNLGSISVDSYHGSLLEEKYIKCLIDHIAI